MGPFYYLGIPFLVGLLLGIIDSLAEAQGELSGALLIIFLILYLWPLLALQAKRWHDRDKSAWWILITLIPIVGSIWTLVELVCMSGTDGANQFGPDPSGRLITISSNTHKQPVMESSLSEYVMLNNTNARSAIANKLNESRQLKDNGLITETEYAELRQSILNNI